MRCPRRHHAFTLVELLVVIAIIALLISILLPSLKRARDQAKALKCGSQLSGYGRGLLIYATEDEEWIPGRNTTGFETWVNSMPSAGVKMSQPHVPVQTYDWFTPILRTTINLPANRAERFRTLLTDYRCPSVKFKATAYEDSRPPDYRLFEEDFDRNGATYGTSYLMPAHFQYWGRKEPVNVIGYHPLAPTTIAMTVARNYSFFSVKVDRYVSRIDRVGTPAEKIAVADGTRYLRFNRFGNILTFDSSVDPDYFGAFSSNGAWWNGSTAYGTRSPTQGANIPLSYRHDGTIESLFFDGHVERLTERLTRKIDYWYPKGGVVADNRDGETAFSTYPNGYVIR